MIETLHNLNDSLNNLPPHRSAVRDCRFTDLMTAFKVKKKMSGERCYVNEFKKNPSASRKQTEEEKKQKVTRTAGGGEKDNG